MRNGLLIATVVLVGLVVWCVASAVVWSVAVRRVRRAWTGGR